MTGLGEVREKLEEIAALDYTKAAVNLAAYNAVHLAREALALMESEQGEQMRRDHEAMKKLRGVSELWFFECGEGLRGIEDIPLAERDEMLIQGKTFSHDPADAILGTESENGEGK